MGEVVVMPGLSGLACLVKAASGNSQISLNDVVHQSKGRKDSIVHM